MAVADRHGLPIACGIAGGQRHEAPLVVETLNNRFIDELPDRLIGDRAYDSEKLDAELDALGVDMIAPNKVNRRNQSQDLGKLRRYKRRWLVERLFSWLMRSRRLVTRYERKANNFLAFLHLACATLLWRKL